MLLRDQHGEASRGLHIYTIRITDSDKSNKSNKSIRVIVLESVSVNSQNAPGPCWRASQTPVYLREEASAELTLVHARTTVKVLLRLHVGVRQGDVGLDTWGRLVLSEAKVTKV